MKRHPHFLPDFSPLPFQENLVTFSQVNDPDFPIRAFWGGYQSKVLFRGCLIYRLNVSVVMLSSMLPP